MKRERPPMPPLAVRLLVAERQLHADWRPIYATIKDDWSKAER
jgi:hypothetical protein